jgi:hypothetical protein
VTAFSNIADSTTRIASDDANWWLQRYFTQSLCTPAQNSGASDTTFGARSPLNRPGSRNIAVQLEHAKKLVRYRLPFGRGTTTWM